MYWNVLREGQGKRTPVGAENGANFGATLCNSWSSYRYVLVVVTWRHVIRPSAVFRRVLGDVVGLPRFQESSRNVPKCSKVLKF